MADDKVADSLKVPPHSQEAEQSVLGALLLDNAAADRVGDLIAESDFYSEAPRLIFRHIVELVGHGKPADVVTLAEALDSVKRLDYVGGLAYLGALVQAVPTAANVRRYAEIVRERSVLRGLAGVAAEIADTAFSPQGRSASQLLDEAEAKVFHIAEQGARGQQVFQPIQPLLTQVVERIEELYARENPSDVTGVPTGFTDLDRMTSGLQPGDLVVIAGRPSMGKAQPLDARVLTPGGWTTMEQLQFGDELASIDGTPSRVAGVYPQGERQVYRVAFSDGRSTECCAEHLWRVHYRDWDAPRVLPTAKLSTMLGCKRYRARLWIDAFGGEFGSSDALPIDPWLLGVLIGDGRLNGSSVLFSTADTEILEGVRQAVGQDFALRAAGGYDWRVIRNGGAHVRGVRGMAPNPIKSALATLGLWGGRSEVKFIPPSYLNADRPSRMALLQGLLDTDGRAESWGSVRFATTSERLAEDVRMLVRSLGGQCSMRARQTTYRYREERRQGRRSWVCNIQCSDRGALFRLGRKQGCTVTPQRHKRLTFASIEPTRIAAVQCIAVTHPSRLYVTDEFLVTHNTAFALNIGEHVALHAKKPVAVFSMEMGATQLAMRMIGSVGRLDQHKLRTGRLANEDWERLSSALGRLNEAQMFIDETPALNPLELRSRARRLHRQTESRELGAIIVDYLQLMQGATQGENRATEISEISRSLKALAKELHVPVLALSQLNRSLEQRPNKRPVMSDLRECVSGDTTVCLPDGTRVPIRELVGSKPRVLSLSADQRIVPADSDRVWCVGRRAVFDVHLTGGRMVRATAEHRLLAFSGWKRVRELGVGDRLAIARSMSRPVDTHLSANDLSWDRIVGLEPAGEEDVFDLTVPGNANWLADGIVSHNSGAIEQDADLILFIYRDEIYNPESQDKGIAEIIIGKQRNGPIGVVRLTFLGEFTRFENYAHPGRY